MFRTTLWPAAILLALLMVGGCSPQEEHTNVLVANDTVVFHQRVDTINANNPYGLAHHMKEFEVGDRVEVSVWRKGDEGELVLSAPSTEQFYMAVKNPYRKEGDWQLLFCSVVIPPYYEGDRLKIYALNGKAEEVLVKDMLIKRTPGPAAPIHEHYLALGMDSTAIATVKQTRVRALATGVIEKQKGDWVEAGLLQNDKGTPVKLRIKGDWLDHVRGHKWSYRIKAGKKDTWRGMREFSIQAPEARSFINEWVFHEALNREGVLTTRYDFIPVYINGIYYGVYAYEEHFTSHLLAHRGKPVAPILKFDESGMWEAIQHYNERKDDFHFYEAAEIEPFKRKSTYKDSVLHQQFVQARRLLMRYQQGEMDLAQVFDLDKMAKFHAIATIFKAYHSNIWHNWRLYYNPETKVLEPVVFDGYGTKIMMPLSGSVFGLNEDGAHREVTGYAYFTRGLLRDTAYVKLYVEALKRHATDAYFDELYAELEPAIAEREALLQQEYPHYTYDRKYMYWSAKNAREKLVMIDEQLEAGIFGQFSARSDFSICEDVKPLAHASVKAYSESLSGERYILSVANYHCNKVTIVGVGENGEIHYPLKTPLNLEPFHGTNYLKWEKIPVEGKHKEILFRVKGSRELFSSEVLKEERPVVD